jgi:protein ImuB
MLTTLERLGIRTLGEFAALERDAVADRFGALGMAAWRLAQGEDEPLRPRLPREELAEWIELPEASSGQGLERALELLVDRLLANRRRRGRSIRRVRLEARLAAGGGWQAEAVMRSPSSSSERLLLALGPKLAQLPAPARELGLRAVALGPAGGEQLTLNTDPADERQDRLGEAIRQARAACGRDALLRVLEVDPGSHVPERRAILTPFHER